MNECSRCSSKGLRFYKSFLISTSSFFPSVLCFRKNCFTFVKVTQLLSADEDIQFTFELNYQGDSIADFVRSLSGKPKNNTMVQDRTSQCQYITEKKNKLISNDTLIFRTQISDLQMRQILSTGLLRPWAYFERTGENV